MFVPPDARLGEKSHGTRLTVWFIAEGGAVQGHFFNDEEIDMELPRT
jgi:hypothetical protein